MRTFVRGPQGSAYARFRKIGCTRARLERSLTARGPASSRWPKHTQEAERRRRRRPQVQGAVEEREGLLISTSLASMSLPAMD
jgi:hypothetical protein